MPGTLLLPTEAIVVLAVIWVAMAMHTGWSMRRLGRRMWVWILITLLLSPVPAAVVSYVDYFRRLSRRRGGADAEGPPTGPPVRRCPHCGALLTGTPRRVAGRTECPRCRMVIEEEYLA